MTNTGRYRGVGCQFPNSNSTAPIPGPAGASPNRPGPGSRSTRPTRCASRSGPAREPTQQRGSLRQVLRTPQQPARRPTSCPPGPNSLAGASSLGREPHALDQRRGSRPVRDPSYALPRARPCPQAAHVTSTSALPAFSRCPRAEPERAQRRDDLPALRHTLTERGGRHSERPQSASRDRPSRLSR